MNWTAFRQLELPFLGEAAYLDYSLRGLVTQSALAACRGALEASARGREARSDQAESLDALRRTLLAIVAFDDPAEVCFTANTTTALALLAGSIAWRPGDRVLLHADAVSNNRLPWLAMARRFELEVVELPSRGGCLDLEDLAQACQEPVAWASFAAVSLATGDLRPLREIQALVHSAGGRLCVDAAQALGCVPVDSGDAIVGSGRKWLCGPPEVGFLLMTDAAAQDLVPLSAGSCSGEGARALEGGVPPLIPAIGLLASLEALAGLGWDQIHRGVLRGTGRVLDAAHAAGWTARYPLATDRQGPLVHLALPEGAHTDLEARLEARGVYVRVLPELGSLRVSAHAWTEASEVEALFAALAAELR